MSNPCSNLLTIYGSKEDIAAMKQRLISDETVNRYNGEVQTRTVIDLDRYFATPREIQATVFGGMVEQAMAFLSYPIFPAEAKILRLDDIRGCKNFGENYWQKLADKFGKDTLLIDILGKIQSDYIYRSISDQDIKKAEDCFDRDFDPLGLNQGLLQLSNKQKYGIADWYNWRKTKWGTKWLDCHSLSLGETEIKAEFDTAYCPPTRFYEQLVKDFPKIQLIADYLEEGCGLAGSYEYYGNLDEPSLDNFPADDVRQYATRVFGYEYDDEDEEEDDGEAELAALDDAALAKQGSQSDDLFYFYLTPAEIKKIVDYANANYASVNQASDFEVALGFFTNLFDEKDILVTKDRSCIEVKGFPMYFNDDGSIKSSEPLQCLLEKYLSGKCK